MQIRVRRQQGAEEAEGCNRKQGVQCKMREGGTSLSSPQLGGLQEDGRPDLADCMPWEPPPGGAGSPSGPSFGVLL